MLCSTNNIGREAKAVLASKCYENFMKISILGHKGVSFPLYRTRLGEKPSST
jgi:hypothetical protein